MATIQTLKSIIGKMKQNRLATVLNCHFNSLEFRGSFYFRLKLCKLES